MPHGHASAAFGAAASSETAEDALRAQLHLPFYLYEGRDFDDGSWFEPCARGLRGEGILEDQYQGEHYFFMQLRTHRWRVRDPNLALLFVVPLYVNAALQPSMSGASCNGTHYQELFDRTAAAVAATEQYARYQGADHVLLCNSWKIAQKPPHQAPWSRLGQRSNDVFRHTFRNAIVGHMEARVGSADIGSFWRCSVVVPYVANYEESARAHLVPPSASARDVSYYFQGGANNRGTYGYAFRQAALAQLEHLPRAHISAFSLPGNPIGCREPRPGARASSGGASAGSAGSGITTNCKAGRSNPAFRALMRRAKFNLVLRGDSPSSRRLYDGIAAGALSVLVSDQLWAVGLPFACLVPWRRMALTMRERPFETSAGALSQLRALDTLSPQLLGKMQRVANRHRRDVLWNVNGSRVAENVLITAALRCLPAHVITKRGGGASGAGSAGSTIGSSGGGSGGAEARAEAREGATVAASRGGPRSVGVAHALRLLRQMCPHSDSSSACRIPDAARCSGCETGDFAPSTPIEHCCADSCPACNRTLSRCLPADVYHGDPLTQSPSRREPIEAYLAQKDKDVPAELKEWRKLVGRPKQQQQQLRQAAAARAGRQPPRLVMQAAGKHAGKLGANKVTGQAKGSRGGVAAKPT